MGIAGTAQIRPQNEAGVVQVEAEDDFCVRNAYAIVAGLLLTGHKSPMRQLFGGALGVHLFDVLS